MEIVKLHQNTQGVWELVWPYTDASPHTISSGDPCELHFTVLNIDTRTIHSRNNYLDLPIDHTHCLLFVFVPAKSCREQHEEFVFRLTH